MQHSELNTHLVFEGHKQDDEKGASPMSSSTFSITAEMFWKQTDERTTETTLLTQLQLFLTVCPTVLEDEWVS
jgi:hypothetical protein